jgi:hypothetical protein
MKKYICSFLWIASVTNLNFTMHRITNTQTKAVGQTVINSTIAANITPIVAQSTKSFGQKNFSFKERENLYRHLLANPNSIKELSRSQFKEIRSYRPCHQLNNQKEHEVLRMLFAREANNRDANLGLNIIILSFITILSHGSIYICDKLFKK